VDGHADLTIGTLPWFLFPLEKDVLCMDMPNLYAECAAVWRLERNPPRLKSSK